MTHWKRPWCWENWRREEKGTTEDEMVGWHHWLNGHEFEQTSGVGDGRWSLVCCSPWGHKESDTTAQLNWTELMLYARFPEINHLIKTSSFPLTNIYPFYLMAIFYCFLLVGWFFHLLNIYWKWAGKQADTDLSTQELCGFFFFCIIIYLFLAMLGLPCCSGFSLVAEDRGYSLVLLGRLLIVWLLLSWSTGFRAPRLQSSWLRGLVAVWRVGSSLIRDGTCVPCMGMQILYHRGTREAWLVSF